MATDLTMISKHLFFDLLIVSCSSEFIIVTEIIYLPIKYYSKKKKKKPSTPKLGEGGQV